MKKLLLAIPFLLWFVPAWAAGSFVSPIAVTTCTTHEWVEAITSGGAVTCTQPAFADLSSTPTTLSGYGIASPLPVAQGGTGLGTLTAAALVLGNGTSAPNFLAEVDGDCVIGATGAWTAGSCTAGGSGTVNTGTAGQLAYYATSTNAVSGATSATVSGGALSLGASATAGSVTMGNATSGTVTVQPVTGALGTVTASVPANTGTVAELNLAQPWTAAQRGNTETPTIATTTFTPAGTAQNIRIDFPATTCTCTIANFSAITAGQSGVIELVQGGTSASLNPTWGSAYEYPGGTSTIVLTTTLGGVDYIPYYVESTGSYIVLGSIDLKPVH